MCVCLVAVVVFGCMRVRACVCVWSFNNGTSGPRPVVHAKRLRANVLFRHCSL